MRWPETHTIKNRKIKKTKQRKKKPKKKKKTHTKMPKKSFSVINQFFFLVATWPKKRAPKNTKKNMGFQRTHF